MDRGRRWAVSAALLAGVAASPAVAAPARAVHAARIESPSTAVAQSEPVTVVPSAGLPAKVQVNRSNANLAVARYRGRYFLVFRTAKWQISDDNTRLYVVSSRDQVHWRYEGVFRYGRDLREPRFLVWRGHLYLYFALLGQNAAAFQPGGELVNRYRSPGRWSKPVKAMPQPDFIAWSFKTYDGTAYMTGYTGGGDTFTPNPAPKLVYWMTSRDAMHWHPVHRGTPVVYRGQCGETDFAFLPDGGLVTACQTEEVDKLGWGAKVCTAPAAATWRWTCRGDRRRLDSPYVFVDRGRAYVLARRQVAFGGNYDFLGSNLAMTNTQFALYDGTYAATTKRCSLWRIDLSTRDFTPIADVPGTGDTCYPQLVPLGGHRYLVYNYTSPFGSDPPWGTALLTGRTLIYRETLHLPAPRSK
ncbi:MAG TPA: hypothetical protein VHD58_06050 [Mycobacteriales bacterium]|nr:hypothetical protein [Mycobacteriales bacterium]